MNGKPIIQPVFLTATYEFESTDDLIDVVQNHNGYIYSRWDNPSVVAFEKAIAELEGYPKAVGFGSGMAAITTSIMANINSESRIVATRELYGGTFEFLNDILTSLGIEIVFVHCWETEKIVREIELGVDVLYLESPTNPLLRISDIKPLVEAAHKQKGIAILDSTFASPVNQHPYDFGVDVVVHSVTKFLGGHHDVTAGIVCCKNEAFDPIWKYRKIFGGLMDPLSAFLGLRGMKTLRIRIEKQNKNAMQIARYLSQQTIVKSVNYPGLKSHPDFELANKQMTGFGGMLSFELNLDFEGTKKFVDNLSVIKCATSLGGVTSLITQPVTNTHVGLNQEELSKAGVSPSLVRLSVGIEDVSSLIDDLAQAFSKVAN